METGFYDFCVQPREVDLTKKATIITVGDHILDAAGQDADKNGFGVRDLQERNTSWVLSRFAIEVLRYPDEYEKYTVQTWVGEINRLMTTRNFIVRDAQGNVIANASSNWAIIDMGTRRPLDISKNVEYTGSVRALECPIERPARLTAVEAGISESHKIRYSDIDFNQHTNSMKYVQWMVDRVPLEMLTSGKLHRIDLNFIHETQYGQTVDILWCNQSECSRFDIKLQDGTPACRGSILWV